jgi:8-oxo-dGTP pyrophosphatase MutT (NUDIX family)
MKLFYKGAGILLYRFRPDGQPTLFIFRRTSGRGMGMYSIPGGARNRDDISFQSCAIRETFEEIGYPILPQQILGQMRIFLLFFNWKTFFVEFKDDPRKFRLNHEFSDVKEVTPEDAKKLPLTFSMKYTLFCFNRYIRKQRTS